MYGLPVANPQTYVRLRVLPEGRKAAAPVAAASSSSGLPGAPTVIDTCKSTVAPLKLDEVDGVGQMRTLVVQLDRRAGLADEEDMESGQQKQQGEGSAKEGAAPDADGPDSPLVIAEVGATAVHGCSKPQYLLALNTFACDAPTQTHSPLYPPW